MQPPELTSIDAEAQALCSQVVSLLIDESLNDPRLAGLVASLEEVIRVARLAAEHEQAPELPGIRDELTQLARTLEGPRQAEVAQQLRAMLEGRHTRRTTLLESSAQHLHGLRARLGRGVTALGSHLSGLETEVSRLAPPAVPVPVASPIIDAREDADAWPLVISPGATRPGTQGDGRALLTGTAPSRPRGTGWRPGRMLALCGVLAALVIGGSSLMFLPPSGATAVHSGSVPGATSPVSSWEHLWSQALAEPVSSCPENQRATTFGACVCPDTGAAAKCLPDPGWPGPRLVSALEAVLHVRQKDVWIDGELGTDLSAALERLSRSCIFPDAQETARTTLSEADAGAAISPAAREAVLTLLQYVRQNPACAS